MNDEIKINPPFDRSSGKTYHLMEWVRGSSTMVEKGPDDTVFSFPIVAILELLLALGMTVLLVGFSLLKNAPLEELANPLITTDPAKAPWYFMGLQELLEHMHPFLAGIILPGVVILFLVLIPYLDTGRSGSGIWFSSARGKRITAATTLYTLIVISAFILLDNAFPPRELLRHLVAPWIAQSLIPGVILLGLALLPIVFVRKTKNGGWRDVFLALFTFMLVAAVVLTLVGFFFRGPGFELYWPWDMPDGYNPFDNL